VDGQDSIVPLNVYHCHLKGETLSCNGHRLNSAVAAIETWDLKGCALKVKLMSGMNEKE
jgi:hypothetical protein